MNRRCSPTYIAWVSRLVLQPVELVASERAPTGCTAAWSAPVERGRMPIAWVPSNGPPPRKI